MLFHHKSFLKKESSITSDNVASGEVVWQHQRCGTFGWWNSDLNLSSDPPKWATPCRQKAFSVKHDPRWYPQVSHLTDSSGWSYAEDFGSPNWANKPFKGAKVRRRRWVQYSLTDAPVIGILRLECSVDTDFFTSLIGTSYLRIFVTSALHTVYKKLVVENKVTTTDVHLNELCSQVRIELYTGELGRKEVLLGRTSFQLPSDSSSSVVVVEKHTGTIPFIKASAKTMISSLLSRATYLPFCYEVKYWGRQLHAGLQIAVTNVSFASVAAEGEAEAQEGLEKSDQKRSKAKAKAKASAAVAAAAAAEGEGGEEVESSVKALYTVVLQYGATELACEVYPGREDYREYQKFRVALLPFEDDGILLTLVQDERVLGNGVIHLLSTDPEWIEKPTRCLVDLFNETSCIAQLELSLWGVSSGPAAQWRHIAEAFKALKSEYQQGRVDLLLEEEDAWNRVLDQAYSYFCGISVKGDPAKGGVNEIATGAAFGTLCFSQLEIEIWDEGIQSRQFRVKMVVASKLGIQSQKTDTRKLANCWWAERFVFMAYERKSEVRLLVKAKDTLTSTRVGFYCFTMPDVSTMERVDVQLFRFLEKSGDPVGMLSFVFHLNFDEVAEWKGATTMTHDEYKFGKFRLREDYSIRDYEFKLDTCVEGIKRIDLATDEVILLPSWVWTTLIRWDCPHLSAVWIFYWLSAAFYGYVPSAVALYALVIMLYLYAKIHGLTILGLHFKNLPNWSNPLPKKPKLPIFPRATFKLHSWMLGIETLVDLCYWKYPHRSRKFTVALAVATVVLAFIPIRYLFMVWLLYAYTISGYYKHRPLFEDRYPLSRLIQMGIWYFKAAYASRRGSNTILSPNTSATALEGSGTGAGGGEEVSRAGSINSLDFSITTTTAPSPTTNTSTSAFPSQLSKAGILSLTVVAAHSLTRNRDLVLSGSTVATVSVEDQHRSTGDFHGQRTDPEWGHPLPPIEVTKLPIRLAVRVWDCAEIGSGHLNPTFLGEAIFEISKYTSQPTATTEQLRPRMGGKDGHRYISGWVDILYELQPTEVATSGLTTRDYVRAAMLQRMSCMCSKVTNPAAYPASPPGSPLSAAAASSKSISRTTSGSRKSITTPGSPTTAHTRYGSGFHSPPSSSSVVRGLRRGSGNSKGVAYF